MVDFFFLFFVFLGVYFDPVSQKDFSLLPFRLELSEEERMAREQVVLPYSTRAGKEVRIYDGRHSMTRGAATGGSRFHRKF